MGPSKRTTLACLVLLAVGHAGRSPSKKSLEPLFSELLPFSPYVSESRRQLQFTAEKASLLGGRSNGRRESSLNHSPPLVSIAAGVFEAQCGNADVATT